VIPDFFEENLEFWAAFHRIYQAILYSLPAAKGSLSMRARRKVNPLGGV
jgi:hypothetical protein